MVTITMEWTDLWLAGAIGFYLFALAMAFVSRGHEEAGEAVVMSLCFGAFSIAMAAMWGGS